MKSIFFCCILAMLLTGTACKKKDKAFLTLDDLAAIAKADYITQNKKMIDKGYRIFNNEGMQYAKRVGKGKQRDDYLYVSFKKDSSTLMTYCTNSNEISELYGQLKAPDVSKISEISYQHASLYFTAYRTAVGLVQCNCIDVQTNIKK
jgi:hypothetical protein